MTTISPIIGTRYTWLVLASRYVIVSDDCSKTGSIGFSADIVCFGTFAAREISSGLSSTLKVTVGFFGAEVVVVVEAFVVVVVVTGAFVEDAIAGFGRFGWIFVVFVGCELDTVEFVVAFCRGLLSIFIDPDELVLLLSLVADLLLLLLLWFGSNIDWLFIGGALSTDASAYLPRECGLSLVELVTFLLSTFRGFASVFFAAPPSKYIVLPPSAVGGLATGFAAGADVSECVAFATVTEFIGRIIAALKIMYEINEIIIMFFGFPHCCVGTSTTDVF